jgi:hypothetical protein
VPFADARQKPKTLSRRDIPKLTPSFNWGKGNPQTPTPQGFPLAFYGFRRASAKPSPGGEKKTLVIPDSIRNPETNLFRHGDTESTTKPRTMSRRNIPKITPSFSWGKGNPQAQPRRGFPPPQGHGAPCPYRTPPGEAKPHARRNEAPRVGLEQSGNPTICAGFSTQPAG